MGQIPKEFIESIPVVRSRKLNQDKLKMIRNLMTGEVGKFEESRTVLYPVVLRAIQTHMPLGESLDLDEPYLCIAILQIVLDILERNNRPAHMVWELHTILPALVSLTLAAQEQHLGMRTLKTPDQSVTQFCNVDVLVDSLSCLLTVLHLMSDEQLDAFIDQLSFNRTQLENFLSKMLTVTRNALKINLYPDMWVVLYALEMSVMAKILQRFSRPIQTYFLDDDNFDYEMWHNYMLMGFAVLSHESLQLEKFTPTKRNFILNRYGDIRDAAVPEIRSMWQCLEEKQLRFTHLLSGRCLEVARTVPGNSQQLATDIYFDLLSREFLLTHSFKDIERHTIDYLYNLAHSPQNVGDTFIAYLLQTLEPKLNAITELAQPGTAYLRDIKQLYDLMCALLKFPDTAVYEDERTSVALRLMEYIEKSGHMRREMYCRYVKILVDLHVSLKSYIEAGMTQLQQIPLYSWNNNPVEALSEYPAETESTRKERLYYEALKFFDEGEAWERAIALANELRRHYEEVYDYDKLSELLKTEAGYFYKIIHSQRYYCNYYRVVYYGNGFDSEIQGKEFVYRSEKMEPVMDFTNRIKKKYPTAKIFMSSDVPPPEMMAQNDQIISITTLTLASEAELEGKEPHWVGREHTMPISVLRYAQNNDLKVFSYAKAVQKSTEKKPANEFKDLWVLKTLIVSEDSFPSNRRRVPVVHRQEVMIPPVQNAVIAIVSKNKELRDKVEQVSKAPEGPVDVGPLSMNLNGMIDAAVNGGTQKYVEAFLTPQFVLDNPDAEPSVRQLKEALQQQLVDLRTGLDVFGRRCDEQLRGLHQHLSRYYEQMCDKMRPILQ
eukprot:TRINITY_DN1049_c0_g1_i6.p1 TRINITY_DN1049_c0_g1~~TRINITY_DN1049_c0_g1_i6.p1  ORF type:complete len:893 (+),score=284.43 TRINITY_DN1049_c0_g1_i6:184-2679(+)